MYNVPPHLHINMPYRDIWDLRSDIRKRTKGNKRVKYAFDVFLSRCLLMYRACQKKGPMKLKINENISRHFSLKELFGVLAQLVLHPNHFIS